MLEELLGVAARSLVRHAVVGVLTGGIGNVLLLAGDIMDVHDTIDAVDAVNTISDSSYDYSGGSHHDIHFGGTETIPDGAKVDSLSGNVYTSPSAYYLNDTKYSIGKAC